MKKINQALEFGPHFRASDQFFRSNPEGLLLVDGFYIYLHRRDILSSSIIYQKMWEPDVTFLFRSLIDERSLVVDVGANIGWFTLIGAKTAKKVYAVEPAPETFALLERSVKKNEFKNTELLNMCVSDHDGVVWLSLADSTVAHSIVREMSSRRIAVLARTLDSLFPLETIDVLKVDVEGAEPQVLAGARKIIQDRRVKHIIMEWNPEVWRDKKNPFAGFRAYSINGRPFQYPNKTLNVHLVHEEKRLTHIA